MTFICRLLSTIADRRIIPPQSKPHLIRQSALRRVGRRGLKGRLPEQTANPQAKAILNLIAREW
jgi:hypothetical protein